jgi:hypothetical protein
MYNAEDFAGYFSKLMSNGIFYFEQNNLKVSAGTGMHVLTAAGSGWINGHSYENTASLELTIPTADGVYPRIDRVVLRLSEIDRNITLAVKTGVALASPVAPTLTRTADVCELGLADIRVEKGVVSIAADKITDTRLDSALCGMVNSLLSAVYE